jgi:hypothetical protein
MKRSALEELLLSEGARVETANLRFFSSCSSSLDICSFTKRDGQAHLFGLTHKSNSHNR